MSASLILIGVSFSTNAGRSIVSVMWTFPDRSIFAMPDASRAGWALALQRNRKVNAKTPRRQAKTPGRANRARITVFLLGVSFLGFLAAWRSTSHSLLALFHIAAMDSG